jgi:phosphonate transport system ATP-binding protein
MTLSLSAAGFHHAGSARASLQPLQLQIARGEQVAIIGPSGAGKTTLLHLLATALQPHSGSLCVLGSDPWRLSRRQRQHLRRHIGLIRQSPALPPRQRVITAVSSGRLGQWSGARALLNLLLPLDRAGVADCLRQLDLETKLFARCDQLSGGQLQRVAIARCLYQRPQLLLADEPVAAMDPHLAAHTLSVLRQQSRALDATLVASLHAVELALQHFPRIIGLRAGAIAFDLPAAAVTRQHLDALYANAQLAPVSRSAPAADARVVYGCR